MGVASQIKDAMNSSMDTEGYFVEVLDLLKSIPRANLYSVAVGLGTLGPRPPIETVRAQSAGGAGGPDPDDDHCRRASAWTSAA